MAAVNSNSCTRMPPLNNIELPLLLQLVDENKNIVESRQTNAVWTAKKQETWSKIQNKYVSQKGVIVRTPGQLKKCWENLKAKAKKEITSKKTLVKKTGGRPEPEKISDTSEMVMTIVPAQITSEPLINVYDNDGILSTDAAHPKVLSKDTNFELENNVVQLQTGENESFSYEGLDCHPKIINILTNAPTQEEQEELCIFDTSHSSNKIAATMERTGVTDSFKDTTLKFRRKYTRKSHVTSAQDFILRLEDEQHLKKMKLLDLQIEHENILFNFKMENETKKQAMYEEEHKMRLYNLKSQMKYTDL